MAVSDEVFFKMLDLMEKKHKTFFPEISKKIDEAVKVWEKKK